MECCKLDTFVKDKEKKLIELCTEKFPEYSKQKLNKYINLILSESNRNTNINKIKKDDNNQVKSQAKLLSVSNTSSQSIFHNTQLASNPSHNLSSNLKYSHYEKNDSKRFKYSSIEKNDENVNKVQILIIFLL